MALAIILLGIAVYEHIQSKNVATSILVGLGIAFFCFGAYWAWNKERDKYEAEVAKHGNPNFELRLGQVDMSYDANRGITLILLSVTITNHGSTSAALSWQLQFNSPVMRITVPWTNLPFAITRWSIGGGQWLLLHQDQMLPAITAGAVETGHSKSGRLLFDIPGHCCPAISGTESVGWRFRLGGSGSRRPEVPVKAGFSRTA